MLMSSNKDETAVHGCHCWGDQLCACVRYWPYRGVGSVCFSTVHNCGNECYAALINDHFKTSFGLILNDFFTCWKFRFAFDPRLNDLQFLVLELIPFAFLFFCKYTKKFTSSPAGVAIKIARGTTNNQ